MVPRLEDLPSNPQITARFNLMKKMLHVLNLEIADLYALSEEIQRSCAHTTFENIFVRDRSYLDAINDSVDGAEILDSKKCTACKFILRRPQGHPWNICHMCWGNMTYDGTTQRRSERISVHKCKNCGHEVGTT